MRQALNAAGDRLGRSSEALLDAKLLLGHVVGRDAAFLLAHPDFVLDAPAFAQYEGALERRARGEPVAYITGESWFYGRRFVVSPAVLVPRPETELLLEAALRFLDARRAPAARVCDVGTGSGALAVSLACERPALALTALDPSRDALVVARRNAETHGAGQRIAFAQSDLFANLPGDLRFTCIVANLPYVRSAALPLTPDPASFEPQLALDGGPDGLAVYRRFLAQAAQRLERGGGMFLEAGPDTAPELRALAAHSMPGATCRIELDYAGLPRVVSVTS